MVHLYITRIKTKDGRTPLVLVAENSWNTVYLNWNIKTLYAMSPCPKELKTLDVGDRQYIVEHYEVRDPEYYRHAGGEE